MNNDHHENIEVKFSEYTKKTDERLDRMESVLIQIHANQSSTTTVNQKDGKDSKDSKNGGEPKESRKLPSMVKLALFIGAGTVALTAFNTFKSDPDRLTKQYFDNAISNVKKDIGKSIDTLESKFVISQLDDYFKYLGTGMQVNIESQNNRKDSDGHVVPIYSIKSVYVAPVSKSYRFIPKTYPVMTRSVIKTLRLSSKQVSVCNQVINNAKNAGESPFIATIMLVTALTETGCKNINEYSATRNLSVKNGGGIGRGVFQITSPSHYRNYGLSLNDSFNIPKAQAAMTRFMKANLRYAMKISGKGKFHPLTVKLAFGKYNGGINPPNKRVRNHMQKAMFFWRVVTNGGK